MPSSWLFYPLLLSTECPRGFDALFHFGFLRFPPPLFGLASVSVGSSERSLARIFSLPAWMYGTVCIHACATSREKRRRSEAFRTNEAGICARRYGFGFTLGTYDATNPQPERARSATSSFNASSVGTATTCSTSRKCKVCSKETITGKIHQPHIVYRYCGLSAEKLRTNLC